MQSFLELELELLQSIMAVRSLEVDWHAQLLLPADSFVNVKHSTPPALDLLCSALRSPSFPFPRQRREQAV
jgi:hypothetical protein